ncbi:MAG: hypothetical protein JJU27_05685 [Gammaproteobacteria bacterium]|nr:hypothetical protein [Gammaproteobacteria bacterium]
MRILFAPVSGPYGSGEYLRTLAIATALLRRWRSADVHLLVSRQMPEAARVPLPVTLLPASPTFHTREVTAAIRAYRPTLVVFDNAGRTAQLRAARAAGARVVFISSRLRQRRRAFRLQWMRLLDEHWIAWPEMLAGSLTPFERLRQAISGGPSVRYFDTLMHPENPSLAREVLARHQLHSNGYVLVIPGGGTGDPRLAHGPAVMDETACRLATLGHTTVLVGTRKNQGTGESLDCLLRLPRMDMEVAVELIRHARLVVCNGGDTLLQVLSSQRACVAAAMVPDQQLRLRRLAAHGVRIGTALDAAALTTEATRLLASDTHRQVLMQRIEALGIANGMSALLDTVAELHRTQAA